ncbi:MAG: Spy/CpxP family protein refolding chaperone [Planctomycetaceae bacterium]|jgi:Spy/CpxP family protein refolding chaperone|nr:Spy/CpxP family protein refolding chaperone [Planctomycetaceae bacterium]
MKKLIITISAVIFVAIIFATNATANKPSEAERFEIFIKTESLIKALELTEDQITKIKAAVDNSYFPHGRNGKRGVDPPPEEGFKMDDEFRTEIYKILTPKQKELVLTYKFQLDGGFNANALYATKLEVFNLTEEQQKKLRKLEVERSGKYQELMKKNRPKKVEESEKADADSDSDSKKVTADARKKSIETFRTQMKEVASGYNEKMKDVLTPEQQELGKKLTEESKGLRKKFGLKEGH